VDPARGNAKKRETGIPAKVRPGHGKQGPENRTSQQKRDGWRVVTLTILAYKIDNFASQRLMISALG